MDYVKIVYSVILIISGIFIFVGPFFRKGDERKEFIYSKAQSYAFMVIIGMLILEVGQSIYLAIKGNVVSIGNGISPIAFLTVVSIIYLATLLICKRKHGD